MPIRPLQQVKQSVLQGAQQVGAGVARGLDVARTGLRSYLAGDVNRRIFQTVGAGLRNVGSAIAQRISIPQPSRIQTPATIQQPATNITAQTTPATVRREPIGLGEVGRRVVETIVPPFRPPANIRIGTGDARWMIYQQPQQQVTQQQATQQQATQQQEVQQQPQPNEIGEIRHPVTGAVGVLTPRGDVVYGPMAERILKERRDAIVGTSDILDAEKNRLLAEEERVRREAEQENLRVAEQDRTEIERLIRQRELQGLRAELGLDPITGVERPALPEFEDDFMALRAERGIGGIESELNALNVEIRNTQAALRQGLHRVEGELAPMELIGAEQQALERQGRERLEALNNRRQTLIEELNTKTRIVDSIMNFKRLDYEAARGQYTAEFNKQLQLINVLEGRRTREQQEANRVRDDARANLNTIANMVEGQTWEELGTEMQSQIRALESRAGIPTGTYQALMREKPEAKILSTTTGTDADGNQIVSFIYADRDGLPGVTRTVRTGIVEQAEGFTRVQLQKLEAAGIDPRDRERALQYLHPREIPREEVMAWMTTDIIPTREAIREEYRKTLKRRGAFGIDILAGDMPFDEAEFQRRLKERGVDDQNINRLIEEMGHDPVNIWLGTE